MEDDTNNFMSDALPILVAAIPAMYDPDSPIPNHNSILTGDMYYQELMNTNSSARFKDIARMDRTTFLRLVELLEEQGNLQSSHLSSGEKLLIFVSVLTSHAHSDIGERWQHSKATINAVVHEVANSLKSVQHILIKKPNISVIPERIATNPKFSPFFDSCIGALDGTQIPAIVRVDDVGFRNRKGTVSQNVLGVCDFDGLFTYVLAGMLFSLLYFDKMLVFDANVHCIIACMHVQGWEGSAADGKVVADALHKGLSRYLNKFYLGDAGYALSRWCLTPYRGVRYHLREWIAGAEGPQNASELFNLRHAQLRNIIERVFGVVKKRFVILTSMHSFNFPFQVDIVMCCFMLHNFIRLNQAFDDEWNNWQEPVVEDAAHPEVHEHIQNNAEYALVTAWRDQIAQDMWDSYVAEMARRAAVV